MKVICSLLLLCFAFYCSNTEAQTRKQRKTSKSRAKKTVEKIPKTISAGVVNGKAINLIVPEYPKSARMTNVYGSVNVQVLINETGMVISAEAVSGHPLLRASSIKAALESTFQPMTLSGEPVRVSGIIIYNFIPNQWNWLEIGYAITYNSSYYTIQSVLDLFPPGYSEEIQLLKQYFEANENEKEFLKTIIASIQGKLSNNEKELWLFSVGLRLGKIKGCCRTDSEKQEFIQQINFLIVSKPQNANSALILALERIVSFLENPNVDIYDTQISSLLRDSENRFPFWGR